MRLLSVTVAIATVLVPVQVRAYIESLGVESALSASPNLLIHKVGGTRYVQSRSDPYGCSVQMTGANLWHVGTAVHLFILLAVLVVVIRLQSKFGTAHGAFETAAVEKREVLERTYPVYLIHCLVAPQTGALVEIHAIHRATPRHQLHLQRAEHTATTIFLASSSVLARPANHGKQAAGSPTTCSNATFSHVEKGM